MSLLPRPENLIKNILQSKTDKINYVHKSNNNESPFNSKNEEIKNFEDFILNKTENDTQKNEKKDQEAIKEILDIFPGSKIDSQE